VRQLRERASAAVFWLASAGAALAAMVAVCTVGFEL
jgi:hypothetical protein